MLLSLFVFCSMCVWQFYAFSSGGLIASRILHSHDIFGETYRDCKNKNPSVIFRLRDSPCIVIMLYELRKNVQGHD